MTCKVLEKHGLLRRMHGGAYPVENAGFETTLASRARDRVDEKRRIAAAAADLLGEAESVFVDEGFTPQLIAEALPTDRPLTVLTASLPVATSLATAPNMTVLLLGGRVRGRTLATVGHWAARMLAGFVIDLAFVGANGISRDHGLTTPDPAVAEVKSQAIRSAHRRIFDRRPHEVRDQQLLPVRRDQRLRADRHGHRPVRRPRRIATRCSVRRSSASDRRLTAGPIEEVHHTCLENMR